MNIQAFAAGLRALSAALPYQQKIDDDVAKFLWLSLDQQIKDEVTDEMWSYAVGRRLSEEEPPKEMAIHLSVLRHIYRCENGRPNLKWGIKPQIAAAIAINNANDCLPANSAHRLPDAEIEANYRLAEGG